MGIVSNDWTETPRVLIDIEFSKILINNNCTATWIQIIYHYWFLLITPTALLEVINIGKGLWIIFSDLKLIWHNLTDLWWKVFISLLLFYTDASSVHVSVSTSFLLHPRLILHCAEQGHFTNYLKILLK